MLSFPFHPQHVVLVTGSNGMVGRYIQDVVLEQVMKENSTVTPNLNATPLQIRTKDSEWNFVTSHDGDLRRNEDVVKLFKRFQPTCIVHCAVHVASVEEMVSKPVDFWMDNVTVNNNILQATFEFQRWCGPIKLVSTLPIEIFQPGKQLLLNLTDIFNDVSQFRAESFEYAVLSLVQLTNWYRFQYGCHFISVLPRNVFGAYTYFNVDSAHFVNLLIAKIVHQKENDPSIPVVHKGKYASKCQVLFARDLAQILIWALEYYDDDETSLATGQEVPILELVRLACKHADFVVGVILDINDQNDGAPTHINNMSQLKSIDYTFQMTALSAAIQQTVEWYRDKKYLQSVN